MKTVRGKNRWLAGGRILPPPVASGISAADLVEQAFTAYNGARLREGCRLWTEKMLANGGTVGMTLTGALTPAGLGKSCLVPLVENGFVDWIISTGANLYHDTHFGLGMKLHRGSPTFDDVALRDAGVIRIYDVVFEFGVLLDTDLFYRKVLSGPEFHGPMSSAEFHNRVGRFLAAREKALGTEGHSLLAACWRHGVPVYTSSPGDSSIGMNVARMALEGSDFRFDVSADVNETAALVLASKRGKVPGMNGRRGTSAVVIFGGGSPKNFALQTEPQIQEVLGIDEKGHDYFAQFTDARPDTGGLSGATPSEAVSWGKIDPDQLPGTVVCYTDATIALPLATAYLLDRAKPRTPKRLYDFREKAMKLIRDELRRSGTGKPVERVKSRRGGK
jgi:deoxyhypusine synthase